MAKLRELDSRAGSILPSSTETRTEYLNRIAGARHGSVGAAISMLARELLDQQRRIAELEQRVSRLEAER